MKDVRQFVDAMKSLYAENDYPSERLIKNQDSLRAFTDEFNSRVDAEFSDEEVASELERIRKDKAHTGGLPRLGRSFHGPHFMNKPR
jgi:hypothetical protein